MLMDGALEFVAKIKENIPDARIYIASNGATVNAKGRIASTGLDRYIDGLFISEDMGVTKPDPAFFEICLDRIGEPGSSCIMIGDSLCLRICSARKTRPWIPYGSCRPEKSKKRWRHTISTTAHLPMMNCMKFSKSGRPEDERKLTEEYQWKKDGFSI